MEKAGEDFPSPKIILYYFHVAKQHEKPIFISMW